MLIYIRSRCRREDEAVRKGIGPFARVLRVRCHACSCRGDGSVPCEGGRGVVETRLLAQAAKHQQAFDLADALEPLPGWLAAWKDEHLDELRDNLETYATKYPDAFRYLDFIDTYEPPPF